MFEANWATRALFVVDRNTLAIQTEDAFAEHLPHLPCYRVPRTGRRFQDEKRVTIVTLQTFVNEYAKYSAGYFDLIIIDECHRSIYGKSWRALDHFDGIKIGLTATPCVMQDLPDVDEEDRVAVRDTLRFFGSAGSTISAAREDQAFQRCPVVALALLMLRGGSFVTRGLTSESAAVVMERARRKWTRDTRNRA